MWRVVLDTNVLINADKGEFSYPKRILDLVLQGALEAVITSQVWRENRLLVDRLVKDERLKGDIQDFLIMAEQVEPSRVQVPIEDKEDLKLLAAAKGGRANFLITEDRHLLDLGNFNGFDILTPEQFWSRWEQTGGGDSWNSWIKNIISN
ncbi:putative toxin-antitoxin system toxin component, PIN family [Patescibacteria group bacterium]|nr:putative toxin-antitoxin system toxin component, PIN family [Patescibacteria group bacterium]